MVDMQLFNALLKAIEPGTRLILVGDANQLPSVAAGNVLKDIIKSEIVKVVRLTQIFRQAQESAIIMNAHRINAGTDPVMNEKGTDFFFVNEPYAAKIPQTIVAAYNKASATVYRSGFLLGYAGAYTNEKKRYRCIGTERNSFNGR